MEPLLSSEPKEEIAYLHDYRLELGEGCIWHDDFQCFMATDIETGKFYTISVPQPDEPLNSAKVQEYTLPVLDHQMTSITSMAPIDADTPEERGVICALLNHGFAIIRISEDFQFNIELLANPIEDTNAEKFNDGCVSPCGRYFFAGTRTDEIKPDKTGKATCCQKFCTVLQMLCYVMRRKKYIHTMNGNGLLKPMLYRLDSDKNGQKASAEPIPAVGRMFLCNGPQFSLDGKKFFICDSMNNKAMAYDYDEDTAQMKGPGEELCRKSGMKEGAYDGASMDTEGHIWWSIMTNSKVERIDAKTGKTLYTVSVPKERIVHTSCCAFGGSDMRTMLITTAGHDMGMYKIGDTEGVFILVRFPAEMGIQGAPQIKWKGL